MTARTYTKALAIFLSHAATAAETSPDQFNNGYTGLRLDIDITAVGGTSPTLTVTIESYDPAKKAYVTELASTALAATGHNLLQIDPRIAASANKVAQNVLPARWRVKTAIGGTGSPSVTFSIGVTYTE